jgi:hypothetical protein
MREKGRAEKERDDSRRSRSRVSPSNRRPHGYIHNVDQASVSYFVTNFPEDCTSEDLWKLFARFGRVGDVFIPSKLDKRGKRFAFVKYMEAKEMEELRRNMEDLWLGTFKLRINKSRFDRRDDGGKREEAVQRLGRAFGESNVHPDRSFKTALVHSPTQIEKRVQGLSVEEDALLVEVDSTMLKELRESFVGKLALNIEVSRIRTTLFMEGLPHISITEMGRSLVLIHSPYEGEMERLCKAKADGLTYYFKQVSPWSPSSFADRRELWVKVFGVPLHVWGIICTKSLGEIMVSFRISTTTQHQGQNLMSRESRLQQTSEVVLMNFSRSRRWGLFIGCE